MADQHTQPAKLYRMMMPDHTCPYGLKSKDLLERQGYEVEDHPLTTRDETDAFKDKHDVETSKPLSAGTGSAAMMICGSTSGWTNPRISNLTRPTSQ